MMFLYHGSNIEIKKIDLYLSKPYKDFGRGFYLSDNYEQALQMANFKTSLLGGNPVVTKFEFDENFLTNKSFNVLRFAEYSKEWAQFVLKNRNQKDSTETYDIVIGPIANDKVGAQIRHLMEGDIDFEAFIEKLKYMKGITFQYFFGTQNAVNVLQNKGICYE